MAVGDFLVSMATVAVVGICMYAMGCGKKGAKK
jgi:hypothetical protein